MTKVSRLLAAATLAGSIALAAPVSAATTIYTSKASFDAAVTSTTIDFNGYTGQTSFATTPVDVGPFTLALVGPSNAPNQNGIGSPFDAGGFSVNGTSNLNGRTSNGGSVVLTFDTAIRAFAANFAQINNGVLDKTQLRFGNTSLTPVDGFFGFVSDEASTTLSFTTAIGQDDGYALDDVQFTPVAAPIPAAVPEPAAWAMMIGGFGVVGGAIRRKRKVSTTVSFA